MERTLRVRTAPAPSGGSFRNLHVAVERRHIPPRPWLWTILNGEKPIAVSQGGFAGAEEAWEAAQRELTRRLAAQAPGPLLRPRRC